MARMSVASVGVAIESVACTVQEATRLRGLMEVAIQAAGARGRHAAMLTRA